MTPAVLFSFVIGYFFILLIVAYFTSRKSNNDSFFIGNRNSNWMLVAFGMIGTSLSGVTFISVPGTVATNHFAYFQVILGYFIGYFIIAFVLLPLYYRLNLNSIYRYLEQRFGQISYKTGALFFILSRTLGATLRLYLVVKVLHALLKSNEGTQVDFWVIALVILVMILLYTLKGGVKTIVWTDTLQTSGMLIGLVVCILYIMNHLHFDLGQAMAALKQKNYTQIFFTDDVYDKKFFLKQIFGGAFITIAMTGLDQEMMQKNISVRTLKGAQKNMISFSFILVFVSFLFLLLGGMLYLFAGTTQLNATGDALFPAFAMFKDVPPYISIIFVIALISALFPSADGAITALTSSFCIDILGINRTTKTEKEKTTTRVIVHLCFAVIFFLLVLLYPRIDDGSIIGVLLKIATYTYGPLLGIFAFGILTKRRVKEYLVPTVALGSAFLCFLLDHTLIEQAKYFKAHNITQKVYAFDNEMLILNGLITFIGLWFISRKSMVDFRK
jgi:Na+/proline symporter